MHIRYSSACKLAGQATPELLTAALLHDVGKILVPLSIFDRVVIVLGKHLFRKAALRWAEGTPHGWRLPFVVAEHHAGWGADLACQAGAPPLTVELIRRHHDGPGQNPDSDTEHLLAALQAADDESYPRCKRKSEESMTVKIAIIGLGQIGASIGLALANHKDQVTTIGYDSAGEVNRKAIKMGAVEKIGHGLYASVEEADMVILALPLDQVRETLQAMAQDVREEAVVIDTAPVKLAVAAWAEEFLPPKRHYVGLTLALNPLLLDETGTGVDSARADLFQNGLAAITAPPGTAGEAIKLAASFVTLLGARRLFCRPGRGGWHHGNRPYPAGAGCSGTGGDRDGPAGLDRYP